MAVALSVKLVRLLNKHISFNIRLKTEQAKHNYRELGTVHSGIAFFTEIHCLEISQKKVSNIKNLVLPM